MVVTMVMVAVAAEAVETAGMVLMRVQVPAVRMMRFRVAVV
jgi:hypothetical protein